MINKLLQLCLVALLATGFSACYDDFDDPAPAKVWTAEDFKDCQLMSIQDFKNLFYRKYGNGESSLAKYVTIEEDIVIKGKVISCDRDGNVYKSLYIYDADSQSAIELKLMVSNYVYYQPGQMIYVKAKGLAIGNYRYNLSLGLPPTETDIQNGYANRNMETLLQVNQHVFEGEQGIIEDSDILVVKSADEIKNLLRNDKNLLGRLIRFENLTYKEGYFDKPRDPSRWEEARYPQYLEQIYPNGSTTAQYTNKHYEQEGKPKTYAYAYGNEHYYGSALFSYNVADEKDAKVNLIARVSGYANFALQTLPVNGSKGSITAILNKYSSKSGRYIKYQLLINSFSDINFEQDPAN